MLVQNIQNTYEFFFRYVFVNVDMEVMATKEYPHISKIGASS